MTMASSMLNLKLTILGVVLCLLICLRPSTSYPGCAPGLCSYGNPPENNNYSQCEIDKKDQDFEKKDQYCGQGLYLNNSESCCCNCRNGTFMEKPNTCNYCRPHTECGPNEEIETIGGYTKDTTCRCRSFPIPWEDCEKINCTVFPPDMTTRNPNIIRSTSTTQLSISGEPGTSTAQPTSNKTTQPCTCKPCKGEQSDGRWPGSAIAVVILLGVTCLVCIIYICYHKKVCCCKKAQRSNPI